MRITCPECGYSKELPDGSIPADATVVSCPKCQQKFPLSQPTKRESSTPVPMSPPEDPVSQAKPQTAVEAIPKAGFWLRVVAALIDTVLVLVLQFSLGFVLGLAGLASMGQIDGQMMFLVKLFGYALSFAYYIVFTGHGGQTPGKMALRIKVIRCDGSDIGYGRAAVREIPAKFISGIILCIGYLMVAFDEQKQGLHDRMVDTYVIKL